MTDNENQQPNEDPKDIGKPPEIAEGGADFLEPEPLQDPYAFGQTAPEPLESLPPPPEPEGVDEQPLPPLPPGPTLEDVEPELPDPLVPPELDLTATASGDQNMPFDESPMALPPPPPDGMGGGEEVVELLRSIDSHLEEMKDKDSTVGVFGP